MVDKSQQSPRYLLNWIFFGDDEFSPSMQEWNPREYLSVILYRNPLPTHLPYVERLFVIEALW